MRIGRTIYAVLIAISVATLPTAVGFAAGVPTAEATQVSASDCDHHHHNAPSDKTQKSATDCACMAGCALTCFGFTAPKFSGIAFTSLASAALKPVGASNHVSSQMGSPPFRPPRV